MAFIVFEGLDGSGKSSLLNFLEQELRRQNLPFICTREPGGTQLGDSLRQLILQKKEPAPCPKAELLMYEASRAQHVFEVIRPALAQTKWVLCDRFSASSVAFQAGGRHLSEQDVEWLNRFATSDGHAKDLQPDLTVLLDLSVVTAKSRREQRQLEFTEEVEDRIEAEAEAFHQRVRESFLKQAGQNPNSWLVLSADHSPAVLAQQLLAELKNRKWL
ncbi:MAG: dTMP kinase [Pseudobdellovibrionaceae bacterium]